MKNLKIKNTELLNNEAITASDTNSKDIRAKLLGLCEMEFGPETFEKWFANLEISSNSKSELILSAPSKFVRDWLIREYIEVKTGPKNLKSIAQNILPQLKKLRIICTKKALIEETPNLSPNINKAEQKVINLSKHNNVFAFGTELNSRFNFAGFTTAKYNKLAVSMAKIAAGIDSQISLFDDKIPLFIHGGVGLGKTHLAQAIAWQIKEFNQDKRVVYLSAEKFMYHFVQSIRGNDVMSFKEKMRSIDVLIVDDVQFIAGKESTQQEFMNCFNSLVEDNKQVVLVCDRCPNDLENIDEKLKSRISGGMVVNFKSPQYQDRITILEEKAKLHKQEICSKVISFIAEKITTSIRDLEGALKKLIAEKLLDDKEINLENAKVILADYVRNSKSKAVTTDKIQKIVANFYGIKIADLNSSKRSRLIARPRQIAMYLAKNLTLDSLPKIGKDFGGKNHATVIHAIKVIEQLMNEDQNLLQEIKALEEKLR